MYTTHPGDVWPKSRGYTLSNLLFTKVFTYGLLMFTCLRSLSLGQWWPSVRGRRVGGWASGLGGVGGVGGRSECDVVTTESFISLSYFILLSSLLLLLFAFFFEFPFLVCTIFTWILDLTFLKFFLDVFSLNIRMGMSDPLCTRGGAVRTRDTADIQQAYMAALALAHEASCHSSLPAVHHELYL